MTERSIYYLFRKWSRDVGAKNGSFSFIYISGSSWQKGGKTASILYFRKEGPGVKGSLVCWGVGSHCTWRYNIWNRRSCMSKLCRHFCRLDRFRFSNWDRFRSCIQRCHLCRRRRRCGGSIRNASMSKYVCLLLMFMWYVTHHMLSAGPNSLAAGGNLKPNLPWQKMVHFPAQRC
jgi:hypothetical protein